MGKIYERVYGLSFVGNLDETAQVLAKALEMPFQKHNSDWMGNYYLSRNEERTEQLRLFDDSGQETCFREDYGDDYHLFLEVSIESVERAQAIERKLGEAKEPLHQAFLREQRAYRECSLKQQKERRERVRESLSRGEDPYPEYDPLPDRVATSPAFLALPEEKRQQRLAAKQEWLAKQEARLKQLKDPHYREELLARLDQQIAAAESAPISSNEPRIVLLKRII